MCKFTYLGYAGCEEPERHYLIRREKCSAKAHLKHWCGPSEQDESTPEDEESRLNLECPMCADVPVVYDQPLLEIAHSRRSVLPAPHYDAVTGKYSRLGRHHAQPNKRNARVDFGIPPEATDSMIPEPLKPARAHYNRSASEAAVDRIKAREVSPAYKLPAATYIPSLDDHLEMPVDKASHNTQKGRLPMPLPMPQPAELTPPSSREASLSPPQSRIGHVMRTIPPGESNRRELESIQERQRTATPQGRPDIDRSRSGSESSATSSSSSRGHPPPPPPPRMPSRKPSAASSTTSETSSAPSHSGNTASRTGRPQHYRKDSTSTAASATSAATFRSSPESGADRFAVAALRSIGLDRTASPERGRRPYRRERGGSSSERSDSPSVWRPTISPPQLQQDSLGMGHNTEIVQSFKQRLVPFAPSKSGTSPSGLTMTPRGDGSSDAPPRARTPQPQLQNHSQGDASKMIAPASDRNAIGGEQIKQATMLRLYPNQTDDTKLAQAATTTMLQSRGQMRTKKTVNFAPQTHPAREAHPDDETLTEVDMQTTAQLARSNGDPYGVAGVARTGRGLAEKVLPAVPAGLRRIKTGQVKTVTVAPPRPPKRSNTSDGAGLTGAGNMVRVKGAPLFKFAGVGGKTQEFEIVSSSSEVNPLGQVF